MSEKHIPKVLIAPLDWGLGHTTRCIPIISWLVQHKCQVLIAAEGKAYTLLKAEFPQIQFIHLKGYRVQYSDSKRLLPFKILCQLPKIFRTIYKEHQWLKEVAETQHLDAVLSDNRFGLYSSKIQSVFITHQLSIKGPNKWVERLMQLVNYKHINKFDECWIPDYRGSVNLAGRLSHPARLPATTVRYIGTLSRLQVKPSMAKKYDALIILSGPEPQRTLLEEKIINSAALCMGLLLLVRGLPGATNKPYVSKNVVVENHLNAIDLSLAVEQSEYVIGRAGYTTLMDMVKLRKKTIVIPTPGQTEQEYLGQHLHNQQICLCITQHHFNLSQALQQAKSFNYQMPNFPKEEYQQVLAVWLENLRKSLPKDQAKFTA